MSCLRPEAKRWSGSIASLRVSPHGPLLVGVEFVDKETETIQEEGPCGPRSIDSTSGLTGCSELQAGLSRRKVNVGRRGRLRRTTTLGIHRLSWIFLGFSDGWFGELKARLQSILF